jgi:long-chain acyl-CoA synthetase
VRAVPAALSGRQCQGEMAYVMNHRGARFAAVGDQEQVDKI